MDVALMRHAVRVRRTAARCCCAETLFVGTKSPETTISFDGGPRQMPSFSKFSRVAFSASTIAIAATLGAPAFAQTQTPTTTQPNPSDQTPPPSSTTTNAPANAQSQGSIVVTGSRIKRPEFSNPNPTQTYN